MTLRLNRDQLLYARSGRQITRNGRGTELGCSSRKLQPSWQWFKWKRRQVKRIQSEPTFWSLFVPTVDTCVIHLTPNSVRTEAKSTFLPALWPPSVVHQFANVGGRRCEVLERREEHFSRSVGISALALKMQPTVAQAPFSRTKRSVQSWLAQWTPLGLFPGNGTGRPATGQPQQRPPPPYCVFPTTASPPGRACVAFVRFEALGNLQSARRVAPSFFFSFSSQPSLSPNSSLLPLPAQTRRSKSLDARTPASRPKCQCGYRTPKVSSQPD